MVDKVKEWRALEAKQHFLVAQTLRESNVEAVAQFVAALERAVNRQVASIRLLALHGSQHEWPNIEAAVAFLVSYDEHSSSGDVVRYEVEVVYSNGEFVRGQFSDKQATLLFLRQYQAPDLRPK